MDASRLGRVRFDLRFRESETATRGSFRVVGHSWTAAALFLVSPVYAAVSPTSSSLRSRLGQ